MGINILETYRRERRQQQTNPRAKNKRTTCFDCVYSRDFDSEFDNQVIEGRVYCRKWLTVLKCGRARHCSYFERNEEVI